MNKKKKYNINTFWFCAMLAFITILFLYLFTDYKIWDMQNLKAADVSSKVEIKKNWGASYSKKDLDKLTDIIESHPVGEVIRNNLTVYLLAILSTALLEYGIIRIRRKKYNPNRYNQLMSSTLVTGFSHELKTPLAVIRALVENWDYIDEEKHEKYMEKITEETEHVNRLVERLNGLSDLSSGVIKLNKSDVNLYSLAEEIYKQQKYMIDERKLNVSIHADSPEKCFVKGDPEMLRLAVANFFSNAVKYSAHEVKVELISGKKVHFRITNDGNVLDKEEAAKVWEIFYKKDAARTDRLGSSGVGLAVTKSILKAHKAKFGCTPGEKETIFWFEMKGI